MKNCSYRFLLFMFMLLAAFAVVVPPPTAPQPTPTHKVPPPTGARPVAPKVIAGPPPFGPLPGEFAIRVGVTVRMLSKLRTGSTSSRQFEEEGSHTVRQTGTTWSPTGHRSRPGKNSESWTAGTVSIPFRPSTIGMSRSAQDLTSPPELATRMPLLESV